MRARAFLKNKIKSSHIDILTIIYFIKLYEIEEEITLNTIIALIIVSKFETYKQGTIDSCYKSIVYGLNNLYFQDNSVDFTTEVKKGKCFISGATSVYEDISKLIKKYSK